MYLKISNFQIGSHSHDVLVKFPLERQNARDRSIGRTGPEVSGHGCLATSQVCEKKNTVVGNMQWSNAVHVISRGERRKGERIEERQGGVGSSQGHILNDQ